MRVVGMVRDIFFYIHRISKFFRETLHFLGVLSRNWREKRGNNADIRIAYNGYSAGPKKDWLYSFVKHLTGKRTVVSWYRPSLVICSPFGSYWLLKAILLAVKGKIPSLFFTEENLATLKKYREYTTYLDGLPSLAMGFDYRSAANYRRFPLWLMYLFTAEFAATASIDAIERRLEYIEQQGLQIKTKFAAMIASHDGYASGKKKKYPAGNLVPQGRRSPRSWQPLILSIVQASYCITTILWPRNIKRIRLPICISFSFISVRKTPRLTAMSRKRYLKQ